MNIASSDEGEPVNDEGCWWLDEAGRCHYEPVVLYAGPCADCPGRGTVVDDWWEFRGRW